MNRVGHAFFKRRMRDEGGDFGGEVSGHYYFRDFYNADSGTIPALLHPRAAVAARREAVRAAGAAALELLHLRRDQLRGRRPARKMDEIERRYADGRISKLDGISVDYDDWHFNVRPSNTEPLLRLNLESLVSRGGHGAPARRGARPHPVVIHCLPIPTPFAVGRVNCYLIDDDPLTLVDTGPNSGKALDELERALREHGRRIEDLERIVITHQHLDHLGLRRHPRRPLRRRGRARSTCSRRWSRSSAPTPSATTSSPEALMLRHGIPRDVVTALRSVSRVASARGAAARRSTAGWPTARSCAFAGRTLQALHRPGHSPSDTLFWDAASGVLIGGDHLIGHISSNPLISRPLGGRSGEPGDGRPRALMMYLRSLRETREMPVEVVLAGPRRAGDRPRAADRRALRACTSGARPRSAG